MKKKVTTGIIITLVAPIFLGTFLIWSSIPIIHQSYAQQQSSATNNNNNNNLLTYENSKYGIKMQYPSNWVHREFNHSIGTSNKSFSARVIVAFTPQKLLEQKSRPTATLGVTVMNLTATSNISLDLFTRLNLNNLRQSYSDFQPVSLNSTAVSGTNPADKLVYVAGGEKTLVVYTIIGDKAYIINYVAPVATSQFNTYLPTAQKMINSLEILNTANKQNVNQISTSNNNSNSISTPVKDFDAARHQYFIAWNHTAFHSTFDTFIENGSDRGYGVYLTHPSLFRPGETITLYVEPVGYGFKQVVDEQGNTLNQINFTANISIAGSNGTQLVSTKDIPIGLINSHNKNLETFITVDVRQHTQFPLGDYKITYNIKDGTGKSFQIIKPIRIANVMNPGTP